MKKSLLLIGILFIVLAIFNLLLAGLFWYASMHTLDGPADLYAKQRMFMFALSACGILLLLLGIGCIIYRGKL